MPYSKYSKKQKGLAAMAEPRKKITGADLKKAKKSPKSAARRKSFCGRMCGMKSKLTSAKTARDPNSRINKSLRAWDCNCK